MSTILLPLEESQIIEAVSQLSPQSKRAVLLALIPDLNKLEELVDYGNKHIRILADEKGISWDSLTETEREDFIDDLLHNN